MLLFRISVSASVVYLVLGGYIEQNEEVVFQLKRYDVLLICFYVEIHTIDAMSHKYCFYS